MEKVCICMKPFADIRKMITTQVGIFALSCIAAFLSAPVYVDWNLVSRTLSHRCSVQGCDFDENVYETSFMNYTIPWETKMDSSFARDQCNMYNRIPNISDVPLESCFPNDFGNEITKCSKWVYDTSIFSSTTVSEFNLVCDNAWLGPLAGSIYMVGMLLGAIVIGDVSDRLGRKVGLLASILLLGCGGFLSSISPNYYMFLIMRFFTGAGGVGLFQIAFIIAVEIVGAKWRTFCGLIIEIPFALGEAMVGVVAFYIRDWRWLQLALTAPSFLLLTYMWFMPESIRWLITQKRNEDAMKIIRKIADFNNIDLSKSSLDKQSISKLPSISESLSDNAVSESELIEEEKFESKTVFNLLKYPNMRQRTLNLYFCWIVCTVCYYGLSSNSGNLGGNLFVNFISTMLIEIPSYVLAYFALDRLGRKGTLCFVLFLGGFACIISGFIPSDYPSAIVSLSLLGKFGCASAFGIIFIYSAEIFPTDYRSVGVGSCSMCARVGGIVAPYISSLANIYQPLPPLVFGSLAILSGSLVVFLPETLGTELPQTLEESESFGRDQPMISFGCCKRKRCRLDEETASNE